MKFGVGVLGATGFIGTPYRREIRESPDDASIVALCARRQDLLKTAAEEDKAALYTADWREVVDHPDVDLVIIGTPDALHHEAAIYCAEKGKHLFCEKPVGVNVAEAEEIWRAYADTGLAHFVPFWTRYIRLFDRAREIVQSGQLGDIRAVMYRWHNPRPNAMPFTWRDNAELSSAGSIADVGSHAYDTVRWILGEEAVRVLAHADVISDAKPDLGEVNLGEAIEWGQGHAASDSSSHRKGTAYDFADIAFELSSGITCSLVLSHASFLRKGLAPELEFHGTKASLAIDRVRNALRLTADSENFETEDVAPVESNRFSEFVFPAMRAQATGEDSRHPNLEDGWRVQRFTDAAALSAKSGQWVDV